MSLPEATYDIDRSYEWNYENGPIFSGDFPELKIDPKYELLGFKLNSRLGVPAGPLLNADFIKLYARLGFDILTYKTVRSQPRASHPAPNCVYIEPGEIDPRQQHQTIKVGPEPPDMKELSITNSFGMPSMAPEVWQPDVNKARKSIFTGQVLIVSLVGTKNEERDYIDDWAYTAAMAKESGADWLELDISCPNVASGAGQIFQDADLTAEIVKKVRISIGQMPLLLKIGYLESDEQLRKFLDANGSLVEGIVAINTLSMKIVNEAGEQALPGEGRLQAGVCGAAIKPAGLEMTERLVQLKDNYNTDLAVVGVGGIVKPSDWQRYFQAGADAALSATGAMWDPHLASKLKTFSESE